MEGKFTHLLHPKDGYALPDCKDSRAKKVLEFLIPIVMVFSLDATIDRKIGSIINSNTGKAQSQEITVKVIINWLATSDTESLRTETTRTAICQHTPIEIYSESFQSLQSLMII